MDSSQFLFFEGDLPKGLDYINWIFSKDERKEAKTLEKFKKDSENNSLRTYEALGDLLGMLYNLAVCGYGCHGGDHKIEYITGRTYNLAISSLKLLRLGHYDESLSLIRSISEIVNSPIFSVYGFKLSVNSINSSLLRILLEAIRIVQKTLLVKSFRIAVGAYSITMPPTNASLCSL